MEDCAETLYISIVYGHFLETLCIKIEYEQFLETLCINPQQTEVSE